MPARYNFLGEWEIETLGGGLQRKNKDPGPTLHAVLGYRIWIIRERKAQILAGQNHLRDEKTGFVSSKGPQQRSATTGRRQIMSTTASAIANDQSAAQPMSWCVTATRAPSRCGQDISRVG